MDRASTENRAKRPTTLIASPAVTSPRTSTSSQSGMTKNRLKKASSNTVSESAESEKTSPRSGMAPQRRHSSNRRHSQDIRRKRRTKRKKFPSRVVILEKEKERLEAQVTRNTVSLVRVTSKNVVYFVLVYSAILCLRAAVTAYIDGVLDELRKKYSLSHSQLDLFQGTQMIGLLASLFFVALLGRNWHKPLVLTIGVLIASLGTMVCAVPYFVERTSGAVGSSCEGYGATMDGVPLTRYAQACQYGQWNSSYINPCSDCLTNQGFLDERQKNLSILCVAGFLIGLGTGLFVTTGFIYIEESGNRKNGPIFYGVFLSMTGFGHFLGSCSTWWFLGYTENLTADVQTPLPWKVMAWWLGFVFYSILLFICSIFFLFFPKWITEPEWSVNARRRHLRHLARQIDQERALRKLKRERRKQKQRRHSRLGSATLSPTSESLNDYVLPDPGSPVSDTVQSTSGPVECLSPMTEDTSVFTGSPDEATQEASSSSSSDSETATDGPEVAVASRRRTSGGTGSSLWIIAEEDSGLSRLPSSALPGKVDSEAQSRIGDETTPVWPLHLPAEANRQSRVVTFASGVPDAAGKQNSSLRGIGGVSRKQPTERSQRKQVSKKVWKTFTALKRTFLLPVFTLSLIGTVLSAYLSAGYRSNVVQFVEVQYGQEPAYASFYTAGLCYSIAETVGPLIGGIIVHKLRLSLFKQIIMIICLLIINLILFVLIFPINLPGGGFQWWLNGNTSSNPISSVPSLASNCRTRCDCVDVQLDPVCSNDGWTKYFSACHAGCTQLSLQNDSIIYSNCSCADGALASSSFCPSDFPVYGAFWVVLFLAITAHSMGQVSVILIFLRSVQDVDRHLALSVAIWIIVVAAFIPGPPVFDALQKATCMASRSNCFGEDVCWMHNTDHYRYVIHGASMAFQLVAICFFAGVLYPLRSDPIEPVGYGKDEVRSGIGSDRNKLDTRRNEAGNEVARQSMMEMVQSRIALSLLASQQDLMEFRQPQGKLVEAVPSVSSGFSELKAELESRGKEEERRRISSSDSSVFNKGTVATSRSDEDAEVTSRQTIFSDQSNDTVFALKRSDSNDGYEREGEEVDSGITEERGIVEERYEDSDLEGTRSENNKDTSSVITHSTRL